MDVLKALSRIIDRENLDISWAPDYAEPGYSHAPEGIAFADWNPRRYERIGKLLEKCGMQTEWSDEWTTCANCGKAIRIHADCYHWTPYYWFDEKNGEEICGGCLRDDKRRQSDYVESLIGNPRLAVVFDWLDLEDYFFECVREQCESGWHPGQTDNPEKIINDYPDKDVIFRLDDQSQFYIRFSVWTRPKSSD